MKKTLLTVPVLALAMSGLADDPYADYIYLTADDTTKKKSWNATGNWSEEFQTDRNYYVPTGKTFYAGGYGSEAGTWAGGELVIGGTLVSYVNQGFANRPSITNLVFLGGSMLRNRLSYGILRDSAMTVLAPENNPFVIQMESATHRAANFDAAVSGAPGTGIRIQASEDAVTNGFNFQGDSFTNFFGTLTVTGEKVNLMRPISDSHYFSMPGKLVVTDSAVFMPTTEETKTVRSNVLLGALEVTDGGVIRFRFKKETDDAYLTLGITNSVRVAEEGCVCVANVANTDLLDLAESGINADHRIAVRIANLSEDAVSGYDVDTARVSFDNEDLDRTFDWKLIVQDKGDGTKDLYAGVTNVATIIKSVSSPKLDSDIWLGGVPATEGMDIYCASRFNPFADFDFSRSRIILDYSGGTHYWMGSGNAELDLNAKGFSALRSGTFTVWGGNIRRLRGGAFALADGATFAFAFMDKCQLRYESEIVGTGSLEFRTYKGEPDVYCVTFENINTNWHGRLTMKGFTNSGSKTFFCNTILGDARSWGGDFRADADTYSAVTLASNTCVYVTNNVCFNDPTRGFLLTNAPAFMVEKDFTLTLSNQVTYAGVVTKSGEGVLELGGTACFEDGQATTAPVAGNNVLIITNGALKVTSRGACDGLAITFAEGSKLIVPAESTDGLFDVKWDAPLTVETENGKIPVEIAVSGTLPEGGFTTTIATLNATAAEQVSVDTFKVAKVPGYVFTGVKKVTTDDGVAYQANFEKHGLILLVK